MSGFRFKFLIPVLAFGLAAISWGQPPVLEGQGKKARHAAVRLIVESSELAAGAMIKAGLHVQLEHGWHVYWKNPGDAGLPIRLAWTLPAGFSVDSMAWPTPIRISIPPLMDYGYEGEVVFPLQIQAPPQAGQGKVRLKAHAKWLACKDICLPEEDHLELDLFWPGTEPSSMRDTHASALLALAHERLPLKNAGWKAEATLSQDLVHLTLTPPDGLAFSDSLWFFPEQGDWMEHAAPQVQTRSERKISLALKRLIPGGELPERLRGVVAANAKVAGHGPQNSFEVDLPLVGAAPPGKPTGAGSLAESLPSPLPGNTMENQGMAGGWNLLLKLVLAFAGGLILNLMPCVLPVLSLKIFDFVQRAGHARLKVFAHGLTFTAGVLVSFWILAGLLLILRQGGEQLGWGYQLQSPSFLVVLCALFFFFSLNLFGVFELGYLFTRLGQAAKQGPSGHTGSFLAGITATLVATPCTAPFMGSAMGFAFTQSAGIALLIFTSVGLGMASPYLLLSGFPSLMRILPKPGEWMEHFKQFMGFPLLATAIWLAWILGRQAGTDALIALLGVLLLGGISAWILGKWAALHRETPVRLIAITLALVVFVPAFVLVLLFIQQTSSRSKMNVSPQAQGLAQVAENQLPWRPYQKAQVDSLVQAGFPVFIDFTADWCLSCKVNEKLALDNAEVVAKFRRLQVTPFKGDWTRSDPHITKALASYGRQSVPLYVLYSGRSAQDYRILPELLSPGLVLEALEKVAPPDTMPNPGLGIL